MATEAVQTQFVLVSAQVVIKRLSDNWKYTFLMISSTKLRN